MASRFADTAFIRLSYTDIGALSSKRAASILEGYLRTLLKKRSFLILELRVEEIVFFCFL